MDNKKTIILNKLNNFMEECKMKKTILKVDGMSCSHCENAVKKSVGALNGVTKVEVDLFKKAVTIEYDEDNVSINDIKLEIEEQGYGIV